MSFVRWTGGAMGLGVALALAAGDVAAQADSAQQQRARSTRRIPVQKERDFTRTPGDTTRMMSAGEVMLTEERARIDSLTANAAVERQRVDSIAAALEAANRENARSVSSIQDSLRSVRGELTTVTTRANVLGDSVAQLGQSLYRLRNGSLFGQSGFYIGLGTGANFPVSTLNDIGYFEGLHITVPFGYHKLGTAFGLRGEVGLQTFDGRGAGPFSSSGGNVIFNNPDPEVYTALGMVTWHMPMNARKTNNFYLMGGGGAYMFRDIGASSGLRDRLDEDGGTTTTASNKTKFGVTGGGGFEFRLIGPTSLFVESRFTNVFANESRVNAGGSTGKNLQWVPLVVGFTLR